MTMYFYLRKDVFNYKDICCFSFFNNGSIFFMINIYSDDSYLASKYLKNTKANIHNVLIIASDFNIRDNNWNLSYSFHSSHNNILIKIVDFFDLSYPKLWNMSKTCMTSIWHQIPAVFGLICAQNSFDSLILYNGLNSTKSLQLFRFIWIKICSHIHLCPLPNYLLQTPQIYLDFMWSFPLSKSELLYSVSLMKHLLRDLF